MTDLQLEELRSLVELVQRNERWAQAHIWVERMIALCHEGVIDELLELYDHNERLRVLGESIDRAEAENLGFESIHDRLVDAERRDEPDDDMEIKP